MYKHITKWKTEIKKGITIPQADTSLISVDIIQNALVSNFTLGSQAN